MHALSSTISRPDHDGSDSGAHLPLTVTTDLAGMGSPEQQSMHLADLSIAARRLNRPQQADRFLLLAWLAFDAA